MPRFNVWNGLRKAMCTRACGSLAADLQATRHELAQAVALNTRLMAERRDMELQVREKNLFLRSLSHELRAPLNAIIGFSEILASGGLAPGSSKRAEYATHIHASGRHLLRLINDVLELSRVEAGDREFFPEKLNLDDRIERVADLLHTPLVRKSLQLMVEVEADVTEIFADPGALKQALLSLVSHAADMACDGAAITLTARRHEPERFEIEVHVSKSMEGRLKHLAEPPGLNVMLARRLVEAQGGEVRQSSTEGSGTSLCLVLNRLQSHVEVGMPATQSLETEEGKPG